jgi:hypothetical protein
MRNLRPLLLAGLLATAFAVPALAQPASTTQYPQCKSPPTPEQQEAGHTLYQAGKKKFDIGEYDKALTLFNEAYSSDCQKHELLIIISRSYELKGNKPEAIRALEVYIDRAKPADAETHRTRIDNMKKEMAAAAASASASNSATSQPTSAPTPPPTSPPPPQEHGHTIYPWLVTGLGVVGLATGISLLVVGGNNFPAGCNGGTCDNRFDGSHQALPIPPSMGAMPGTATKDTVNTSGKGYDASGNVVSCASSTADGCAGSDYNRKRQQDAGTYSGLQTGGIIAVVVGGTLIAGGIVWHFLEPTGPDKSAEKKKNDEPFKNGPLIAPVIAPGYGGVALGATF